MNRNCIILKDGEFKPFRFNILLDKFPLDHVLLEPTQTYHSSNNRYTFIDSGVIISWEDKGHSDSYEKNFLEVYYKGIKLFSTRYPTLPVVLDVLNKFKNISKEELNNLLVEKQEEEKTALEIEIEKLREGKAQLIEESNKYKKFIEKGKEFFSLLNELDMDKT